MKFTKKILIITLGVFYLLVITLCTRLLNHNTVFANENFQADSGVKQSVNATKVDNKTIIAEKKVSTKTHSEKSKDVVKMISPRIVAKLNSTGSLNATLDKKN